MSEASKSKMASLCEQKLGQLQPLIEVVCPPEEELRDKAIIDTCPIKECGKTVDKNPSAIQMHLAQVHRIGEPAQLKKYGRGKRRARGEGKPLTPFQTQQFACPVKGCNRNRDSGRYFSTIYRLRQHYLNMHCEKKYVCDECGTGFGIACNFRRHKTTNCNKIYHCSCGCPFTTREAILTHARRKGHTLPEELTGQKLTEGKSSKKTTTSSVRKENTGDSSKSMHLPVHFQKTTPAFILPKPANGQTVTYLLAIPNNLQKVAPKGQITLNIDFDGQGCVKGTVSENGKLVSSDSITPLSESSNKTIESTKEKLKDVTLLESTHENAIESNMIHDIHDIQESSSGLNSCLPEPSNDVSYPGWCTSTIETQTDICDELFTDAFTQTRGHLQENQSSQTNVEANSLSHMHTQTWLTVDDFLDYFDSESNEGSVLPTLANTQTQTSSDPNLVDLSDVETQTALLIDEPIQINNSYTQTHLTFDDIFDEEFNIARGSLQGRMFSNIQTQTSRFDDVSELMDFETQTKFKPAHEVI